MCKSTVSVLLLLAGLSAPTPAQAPAAKDAPPPPPRLGGPAEAALVAKFARP
jgi:hypothetical protein